MLAGITIAIMYGLNMPNAIDFANSLYVDTNIFYNKELYYKLPQLPSSCHESAQQLLIDRNIYQENNIFPPFVIEGIVNKLLSYNDKNLSERLYGRDDKIIELVNKYIHC